MGWNAIKPNNLSLPVGIAQLAGTVEYTVCTSTEE